MAQPGPTAQGLQQNPLLMASLTNAQVSQILPANLLSLTPQHMHHFDSGQIVFLTQLQIQSLPPNLIRALDHLQVRGLTPQQRTWLSPQQKTALLIPNVVALYVRPRRSVRYPAGPVAWLAPNTISVFNATPSLTDNGRDLYRRIHAHLFLFHDASHAYSSNQTNIIPATIAGLAQQTQNHWCRQRQRGQPNEDISWVVKRVMEKEFDDAKKKALQDSTKALLTLIDNIGGMEIWHANQLTAAQVETHRRNLLRRWYQTNPALMAKTVLGGSLRQSINIEAILSPVNAGHTNAQGALIQPTLQRWLEDSFVETMMAANSGYVLPGVAAITASAKRAAKTTATVAWATSAVAFHAAHAGVLAVEDVPLF